MTRDYRTLDAIVVIACLVMMFGVGLALTFVKIPQENLPILAGLASGVIGSALGAYVGARWGNKKPTTDEAGAGSVTVIPPNGTVTVEPASPEEKKP